MRRFIDNHKGYCCRISSPCREDQNMQTLQSVPPKFCINNTFPLFVIVYFCPQRQYRICVNIDPCKSSVNPKDKTRLECIQSPLFTPTLTAVRREENIKGDDRRDPPSRMFHLIDFLPNMAMDRSRLHPSKLYLNLRKYRMYTGRNFFFKPKRIS